MQPVHERGKIAAWIAPPRQGINGQPFDYDYVHLARERAATRRAMFNACEYLLDRHVAAGRRRPARADRRRRRLHLRRAARAGAAHRRRAARARPAARAAGADVSWPTRRSSSPSTSPRCGSARCPCRSRRCCARTGWPNCCATRGPVLVAVTPEFADARRASCRRRACRSRTGRRDLDVARRRRLAMSTTRPPTRRRSGSTPPAPPGCRRARCTGTARSASCARRTARRCSASARTTAACPRPRRSSPTGWATRCCSRSRSARPRSSSRRRRVRT